MTCAKGAFQATLEPDGQGGDWLTVDRKLREEAGADAGDAITLSRPAPISPGRRSCRPGWERGSRSRDRATMFRRL
jgi:hypothetical protein